jgi:hypothetical protein
VQDNERKQADAGQAADDAVDAMIKRSIDEQGA